MKSWAGSPMVLAPALPALAQIGVVDEMRTREESLRLPAVVGAVGFPFQAISEPPTTPWTEAPYPPHDLYPLLAPRFFLFRSDMGG